MIKAETAATCDKKINFRNGETTSEVAMEATKKGKYYKLIFDKMPNKTMYPNSFYFSFRLP